MSNAAPTLVIHGSTMEWASLKYVVGREIRRVDADELVDIKPALLAEDTYYSGYRAALTWLAEQMAAMSFPKDLEDKGYVEDQDD